MSRKATQAEYDEAVQIYQNSRDGQSAVEKFAEERGIDSRYWCMPCETDTPDCEGGWCLVCGTQKHRWQKGDEVKWNDPGAIDGEDCSHTGIILEIEDMGDNAVRLTLEDGWHVECYLSELS